MKIGKGVNFTAADNSTAALPPQNHPALTTLKVFDNLALSNKV
jgi:hypothetical protein